MNGCLFESRSSRQVGTLDKSFTRSCLWRFGVKLRHGIRAVTALSGAPVYLSSIYSVYRERLFIYHPSIHPASHLTINLTIHHQSIYLSIYPFIYPSVGISIHPSIHPYIHPSIHPSSQPANQPIKQSTNQSINLSLITYSVQVCILCT